MLSSSGNWGYSSKSAWISPPRATDNVDITGTLCGLWVGLYLLGQAYILYNVNYAKDFMWSMILISKCTLELYGQGLWIHHGYSLCGLQITPRILSMWFTDNTDTLYMSTDNAKDALCGLQIYSSTNTLCGLQTEPHMLCMVYRLHHRCSAWSMDNTKAALCGLQIYSRTNTLCGLLTEPQMLCMVYKQHHRCSVGTTNSTTHTRYGDQIASQTLCMVFRQHHTYYTLWLWWLFPRVRGFWENVRQFIPRLRFFFFLKWRLARAH